MKTSILEKSTWKWIVAWLATCFVFFLGVFAADFVSFDNLKITDAPGLLTQGHWNGLVSGVQGFVSETTADFQKYAIPVGAVMIFDWGWDCPAWWTRRVWKWWKLIKPLLSGEWTAPRDGWWSNTFTIQSKNLPKHSHAIISNVVWGDGLSAGTSLAVKNFEGSNVSDSDYILKWSSSAANVGKTSEVWEDHPEPITFIPEHQKVLFCMKISN